MSIMFASMQHEALQFSKLRSTLHQRAASFQCLLVGVATLHSFSFCSLSGSPLLSYPEFPHTPPSLVTGCRPTSRVTLSWGTDGLHLCHQPHSLSRKHPQCVSPARHNPCRLQLDLPLGSVQLVTHTCNYFHRGHFHLMHYSYKGLCLRHRCHLTPVITL